MDFSSMTNTLPSLCNTHTLPPAGRNKATGAPARGRMRARSKHIVRSQIGDGCLLVLPVSLDAALISFVSGMNG